MNNTLTLIKNRRSLRSFSDRKIENDKLEELKKATLQAPTAGAMMLYSIIEIKDQLLKDKLSVLCDNQEMISKAPLVWIYLADSQKWENFYKESGAIERGKQKGIDFRSLGLGDMHLSMQDAIIAAQTTVTVAESLGLGSCYIGDIIENNEIVRPLLNLKKHTIISCMLIMGYPKNENRNIKPGIRCPEKYIFMEDEYKEPHLQEMSNAFKEIEESLRKQNSLPYGNKGTIADYYYLKKHSSSFMKNMNKSAEDFILNWK
ncbi:MAG: nitroreductase family protein [Sphaerochaetaceae bacterium]|nr:nitroreductase family protein [Sphaerochaetaceae bacterium]